MAVTRRTFLGTLAAAVVVGFAKVETAVVERPGPTYVMGVDWGFDPPSAFYGGVPVIANEYVPRNVVYFISTPAGPRYFANQLTTQQLHERSRRFGVIRGASGDPTYRE